MGSASAKISAQIYYSSPDKVCGRRCTNITPACRKEQPLSIRSDGVCGRRLAIVTRASRARGIGAVTGGHATSAHAQEECEHHEPYSHELISGVAHQMRILAVPRYPEHVSRSVGIIA